MTSIVKVMAYLNKYVQQMQKMQKRKQFPQKRVNTIATNLDRLIPWAANYYYKTKETIQGLEHEQAGLAKQARAANDHLSNPSKLAVAQNVLGLLAKKV